MSARRSSVSLSPGCHTGSFCILFHVFLFRRESGNSRRQLTHARPLPQSHIASTVMHFRECIWRGGGWLLIVMDEFLITFALMLQLHPPITLVLPWRLLSLFTCCFVLTLWNFRVCLPRARTFFYRRFRAPTDD